MVIKARELIQSFGFNAYESHCALEAKPPVEWNKGILKKRPKPQTLLKFRLLFVGRASIYILRTAFGVDWSERIKIIYAGDDATDEDAMTVGYHTLYRHIEIELIFHKLSLINN